MSKEEKIILNVGGVKYETYKSTFTAYPDTLLGTMFQEHNSSMLHPANGNEYFFDRNGKAFHYIMEFYRTGKFLYISELKDGTTRDEIQAEFDFFQINILKSKRDEFLEESQRCEANAYNILAQELDSLVTKIVGFIIWNIERGYSAELEFTFYSGKLNVKPSSVFNFRSFEKTGYLLVDNYKNEIQKFLTFRFPSAKIAISKGLEEYWILSIKQYFKKNETIKRSVLLSTTHEEL
ncbi:7804_t:CDS:2 [Ambispora gerdemannii]|uniref:7804_t:CDS:1 n=1 Tax=Ambispora gerdemannii TaxID=144530 RepID=A0A9N9B9L0_9GLOM|nr:7804_t:CDS:2 [Ambispora gerdemannii]